MLFRAILFNFIIFIDCGLQIPGMYPKGYFQLITHISVIVKINKKTLLVLRNRTYIYTQFNAQIAGNSVLELPDFTFFQTQIPLAKGALQSLVNTVAYSSQTGCPLQTLLKPLMAAVTSHEY